jgi:hypothetical protein
MAVLVACSTFLCGACGSPIFGYSSAMPRPPRMQSVTRPRVRPSRRSAREIVLVNRARKTAQAAATDIRYATPLCDRVEVKDADYDGLEGAGLVLITSGVNEKTGGAIDRSDPEGRIKLLDQNAAIYREIVPKIVRAAPNAVLVDGSATAPGPRGALAAAETESREAHGRIKGFEGDRTQRTIARKPPHPAPHRERCASMPRERGSDISLDARRRAARWRSGTGNTTRRSD